MGDEPEIDRDGLLQRLRAAAAATKPNKQDAVAAQRAKSLLEALETSKTLDRDTLKRPVNI